jgi:hypothetical protein
MELCIDRYLWQRSCSCWRLCRFRRSTVEATHPLAATVECLATVGSPDTRAARLSAVRIPAQVSRRIHLRAAVSILRFRLGALATLAASA